MTGAPTPGPGTGLRHRNPLVLMYHAIGSRSLERDPDNLFVPLDAFRRQLDELERSGRTPVTLEAYLDGTAPPAGVLLTFDDAYVSILESAAPELCERGWQAVVYVASRTIGRTASWNHDPSEPLLPLAGLRELLAAGCVLGAHARTHVRLDGLPPDVLRDEVHGCAQDLGEHLGSVPATFAYPFGSHDAAARAEVAAAGFRIAFAVHDAAGRFARPRVDVNAADTDRTFRLKLHPAYRPLRRAAGLAPPLRRTLHRLAGSAR